MDVNELARIDHNKTFCRHPWETARIDVALAILKKHLAFPVQSIIDIGSGDGYVIQQMFLKNLSNHYTAVDIGYDDTFIRNEVSHALHPQITITSSLPEAQTIISDKGSTLYLLMDVLEHLENESVLLRQLQRNRSENASYLLITVPANQYLYSSHDTLLGHYRRYNRKSVIALCQQYQLQPIESGYFFLSLWCIRILQLGFEKIMKSSKKTSVENWQHGKWISAIVRKTLILDYQVSRIFKSLGINLPGLSVYCLCKI